MMGNSKRPIAIHLTLALAAGGLVAGSSFVLPTEVVGRVGDSRTEFLPSLTF